MTDKTKKEIIADMKNKVGQFQQWQLDYAPTGISEVDKLQTVTSLVIEIATDVITTQKDMTVDEVEHEYNTLTSGIAMLSRTCKRFNVPSPTPRGGGTSLPSEIVSARQDVMQYAMETLLPAFEEIFPVLGHIVRVPSGDGGMSYNDAEKSAKDFLTRHLSNWVKPVTEGAYRIHAKGYSSDELSDSEFLKENNMFNKAYLTVDGDGAFDTQVINGITVLNYERTMTNPVKKGGNS